MKQAIIACVLLAACGGSVGTPPAEEKDAATDVPAVVDAAAVDVEACERVPALDEVCSAQAGWIAWTCDRTPAACFRSTDRSQPIVWCCP